jgi:hypothetical protein
VCAGAPLAESDLTDAEDLRKSITKWLLLKSMEDTPTPAQYNATMSDSVASPKVGAPGKLSPGKGAQSKQAAATPTEDLYDF